MENAVGKPGGPFQKRDSENNIGHADDGFTKQRTIMLPLLLLLLLLLLSLVRLIFLLHCLTQESRAGRALRNHYGI